MNLCQATFKVIISCFNDNRNSFFRDFSDVQRIKHFVCHLVDAMWSLKESSAAWFLELEIWS